MTLALLIAAAVLTSMLSAVTGMAGGVSLLSVMALLLEDEAIIVPLFGIVQLASNMSRTVVFLRHVQGRAVAYYFLPLAVGTAIGIWIYTGTQLSWLKPAIGAIILAVLFLQVRKPKLRELPLWTFAPLGFVVGPMSILIGATGPLIAPFFLRASWSKEEIIATKAFAQATAHLLKIPAFLAVGFAYHEHLDILLPMIVAVIVGTFAGKKALSYISEKTFTLLFRACLSLVAARLLAEPWI